MTGNNKGNDTESGYLCQNISRKAIDCQIEGV